MPTPRVVASLAPAASAVRVRIELEREDGRETVRNVKAPDLWSALKELLVLRDLHENEGAGSLDLTLDPAVLNQALSAPAVEKVLANNHLHSVDVAFGEDGLVLGVVAKLGPIKLPRRQYTIGLAARRGSLELDLGEILAIPVVGSKVAAVLDAKAEALDWITIRRRDNLLTVAYRQLRCERVETDDALHVTLSAPPPRTSRTKPTA